MNKKVFQVVLGVDSLEDLKKFLIAGEKKVKNSNTKCWRELNDYKQFV